MANLNKVLLIGRLTRDPETRATGGGTSVCSFGLAINRTYTKRDSSEKVEETCFVDVEAWGRTAETIARYMTQGPPDLHRGPAQIRLVGARRPAPQQAPRGGRQLPVPGLPGRRRGRWRRRRRVQRPWRRPPASRVRAPHPPGRLRPRRRRHPLLVVRTESVSVRSQCKYSRFRGARPSRRATKP